MKLAEYAEKSGKTIDEVKDALTKTNQVAHPNRNVDEAALNAFFAGTWTPPEKPPEKPPEDSGTSANNGPAEEESVPKEINVSEMDPILIPKAEIGKPENDIPASQRVAPQRILGVYEDGMSVFGLIPRGPKSPLPAQEHRAYGHDSSQAIANVMKFYGVATSEVISWSVTRVRKLSSVNEA